MPMTINDKRSHDLSPDARMVVKRANTRVVGKRFILARVKATLSVSGVMITQIKEYSKSREGRKLITDLVYKAVYAHYRGEQKCHSYSCERARSARRNMKRELRRVGAQLNMHEKYTYGALHMLPVKDSSRPMSACYCGISERAPIDALTPLALMVSALPHNRKPQRYIPTKQKPVATIETGEVYLNDTEMGMVESILARNEESYALRSYNKPKKIVD